jgi:hypothetical protein
LKRWRVEAMKRKEDLAKNYQTFEDLEVYQVTREFRKAMYRVAKQLPDIGKFGLPGKSAAPPSRLQTTSLKVMDDFIFSIR